MRFRIVLIFSFFNNNNIIIIVIVINSLLGPISVIYWYNDRSSEVYVIFGVYLRV